MKLLITGCCGFIGYSFSNFLLKKKNKITGIDNINNYYNKNLKLYRLKVLKKNKNFSFKKLDIRNKNSLKLLFKKNKFDVVIHLAAQAGVRYSLDHPNEYIENNINGYFNILETSKEYKIKKLFYASSSSVYGDNSDFPLKENFQINPKNLYGLSKKNNEEISEVYSKLYNINLCGLRFFTVFGEWGRPDMFMIKYLNTKKNEKFYLYNYGNHYRDFTYIMDVNKILYKLIKKRIKKHQIFNICSNKPYKISNILNIINKYYKEKKIKVHKIGLQKTDVIKTHGSNKKIRKFIKYKKFEKIETAIKNLVIWYSKFSKTLEI